MKKEKAKRSNTFIKTNINTASMVIFAKSM